MHIDPFTIVVFNIIASLFMSAGLFMVSRGHLSDMKGIRRWATALFILGIAWILSSLLGVIPNFFSMVIASTLYPLGVAVYFHALLDFKKSCLPTRWVYLLVGISFIGHLYFVHIAVDIAGKIVVTAACMAILLFANSVLLFTKQHGFCPVSHRLTGTAFAVSAGVSLVRAIYYLVWNTDAHQAVYQHNFIQDISYLTTSFIIVGTSFGFLLMCNDKYVTEKKRAQLAQQEALDRFQILFDRASDGIVLVNLNGQLVKVNKSFAQMHGYTPEEMQTMKLRNLGTPATLRLLPERMQRILSRKSMIFELEHYHKEGHIFPLEISASLIFSNGEPLIQSFVRDITERKADEETIKQLAFYDPLTNLPNRRLLNERLKHCIEINCRTGSKTAVLMIDLDKFKAVNDSLGHAAGDELLKQVAERIKVHLREIDMVARLGGDEFVVLIDEVNHYEDLGRVAKAIIHTLSQSFTLSDTHQVTIGASIGIAIHPEHGNAMEQLMDNADTALYQAKNSGRGCFACFS